MPDFTPDEQYVLEEAERAYTQLTRQWSEAVDYTVIRQGEREERRVIRMYAPLLDQLRLNASEPLQSRAQGPSGPNKSGSRPPGNIVYTDLIDTISEEVSEHIYDVAPNFKAVPLEHQLASLASFVHCSIITHYKTCNSITRTLKSASRRARELLGYQTRVVMLADTSCDRCGGALQVAMDASTDVTCIGSENTPPCGRSYDRLRWIDLL